MSIVNCQLDAQLRIGIHLGDITIENHEIYGDGVNVASRIESIADPGSVYISEAVYRAIKGHGDIRTQFMGEKRLKNVQGSVRVYKILAEDAPTLPAGKPLKRYAIPGVIIILLLAFGIWQMNKQGVESSRKTIAVLPFKLLNPNSSNQFLIQGITEELIRSLGKVNALVVINPRSTLRFEASLNPMSDAQGALNQSDYFLTGSFEEKDNLLKLDLELFDQQEREVWAKSYTNDITMLPVLTGVIAVDLAVAIKIELSGPETDRLTGIPAMDPELLELLLKGKNHLFRFTPEDIAIGMNYLQQAKNTHPASSRAWSMLAEGLVFMGHSPAPPPGVRQEAKAAAIRAIQLDSLNAEAWGALAHTKTYFEWDYEGAVYAYNRANKLNPNMAMNHYHYAWHLHLFDSLNKAIDEHTIAQDLDPLDPLQSAWLGWLYVAAGDLEQAMAEVKRSLRVQPSPFGYINLSRIYLERKEYDSAYLAAKNAGPFSRVSIGHTYFKSGQLQKGMEIIREMESEPLNSWNAHNLATLYAAIDSLDRFFQYANYEPAHAFMPWLRKDIENPKVIADPRFKQLMDKMNLPMPVIKQKPEQGA